MKKFYMALAGILAAIIVFVVFSAVKDHFTFLRGENTAAADAAHKEVVALKPVVAKAETVFVHDTVRLRRDINKYDSSADAYRYARDTTKLTDTAAVKTVLAKADTAIAHADTMKLSCDTTVKHAGSVMFTKSELEAAVERENKSIRALIPGRSEKVITATKWVGVGIALDRLVTLLLPHR